MGRVTGSWDRPIQGVSQQADKDRINGQCTLQENLIPSPLYGLVKRTGTKHISKLMNSVDEKSLWYSYSRGDDEAYLVLIEPNSYPRIFGIDGIERVVNTGTVSLDYLHVPDPKGQLRINTVADYSFILNTGITVRKLPDLVPDNPALAIIYCQYATYARDYTVIVNGETLATYFTRDGSETIHAEDIRTNNIIDQLASQINSGNVVLKESLTVYSVFSPAGTKYFIDASKNIGTIQSIINKRDGTNVTWGAISGKGVVVNGLTNGDLVELRYTTSDPTVSAYTAEVNLNTFLLRRVDGTPFSVTTQDSSAGNDLIAVQDRVEQLTNLPPYAPEGYVVKVQNKAGFKSNAYWLRAETDPDGTDQSGSSMRWVESNSQGSLYKLNKLTLPHTLVSEPNGTFTLNVGEWEDRQVGDDDTNPFPSFVDGKILSIGTFQNRMLFTSGEAAVFSRTNLFFDFFRETTQEETSADPIDAFADASEINDLIHHAVLDGDIIFFAANGQFLISGSTPITKADIVFKKVTSYPLNTKASPAITGESIMFSFVSGSYAGIREMFTDSFTDTKRARPLTEHVAEYIKGVPVDLISSPNINTLLIRTDISKDIIYVYDWLWSGDQKIQSAFHKWTFNGDVLFAKFIRDRVYFVIDRADGVFLEQMPISSDEDDDGLDFPIRLDQRAVVNALWVNDRWEWYMPYYTSDLSIIEFVLGSNCWEGDRGTSVTFDTDGTKFWTYDDLADVEGGVLSCNLTLGSTYKSRYIPTKPFLRDYNGRVLGLDRFTLGKVSLNYESIGLTNVKVSAERSRRSWSYDYNGRSMGSWSNRVGFAPLDSGTFEFPVRLESDNAIFEVSTSDYRPFILRDMEWSGMFKQRGKRL